MDVSLATPPVEDYLCCYQVDWLQCKSPLRRSADWLAQWWFSLFGENYYPPAEHLMNGTAFAANVEVVDYFRQVYGFTRTQWLEDLARLKSRPPTQVSPPTQATYAMRPVLAHTANQTVTNAARRAFDDFCQASTSLTRDAEPIAPPNAAPPHR
jgi:hypothetical protein